MAPLRKKPVIGFIKQTASSPPSTFKDRGRPPPLPRSPPPCSSGMPHSFGSRCGQCTPGRLAGPGLHKVRRDEDALGFGAGNDGIHSRDILSGDAQHIADFPDLSECRASQLS